jgi:hypothetical protein
MSSAFTNGSSNHGVFNALRCRRRHHTSRGVSHTQRSRSRLFGSGSHRRPATTPCLDRKTTHNGADYSDGFAPLVGDNPSAGLDEEIRWLCQIAKHYAQLNAKTYNANVSD